MSEFKRVGGRLMMKALSNVFIELPDGPWHSEPDRVEWRVHGFPCLVVRGPLGAWCGYVAVHPSHPWMRTDEIDTDGIEITYSAPCKGDICHVPLEGERDDVRWFGFDCAHAGDLVLSTFSIRHIFGTKWPLSHEVYRTYEYARATTERLAMAAHNAEQS